MLTKNHYDSLSAVVPCYTESGDHSRLLYESGQIEEFDSNINTILKRLAVKYAVNLTALRKQAKQKTGHGQLLPLAFSFLLLLFPVKVRFPRVKSDKASGYINIYAVEDILPCSRRPYFTAIKLLGGHTVFSPWRMKTVEQEYRGAKLVSPDLAEDPQSRLAATMFIKLFKLMQQRSTPCRPLP